MKKYLIIFLSLFLICPVFAQEIKLINLSWSDYAPDLLLNAQYEKINWYDADNVRQLKEIYNYWYKRKIDFLAKSNTCKALSNAKDVNFCLINLDYEMRVENQKELQRLQLKQAQNNAGSALTNVSNYLDSQKGQEALNTLFGGKYGVNAPRTNTTTQSKEQYEMKCTQIIDNMGYSTGYKSCNY